MRLLISTIFLFAIAVECVCFAKFEPLVSLNLAIVVKSNNENLSSNVTGEMCDRFANVLGPLGGPWGLGLFEKHSCLQNESELVTGDWVLHIAIGQKSISFELVTPANQKTVANGEHPNKLRNRVELALSDGLIGLLKKDEFARKISAILIDNLVLSGKVNIQNVDRLIAIYANEQGQGNIPGPDGKMTFLLLEIDNENKFINVKILNKNDIDKNKLKKNVWVGFNGDRGKLRGPLLKLIKADIAEQNRILIEKRDAERQEKEAKERQEKLDEQKSKAQMKEAGIEELPYDHFTAPAWTYAEHSMRFALHINPRMVQKSADKFESLNFGYLGRKNDWRGMSAQLILENWIGTPKAFADINFTSASKYSLVQLYFGKGLILDVYPFNSQLCFLPQLGIHYYTATGNQVPGGQKKIRKNFIAPTLRVDISNESAIFEWLILELRANYAASLLADDDFSRAEAHVNLLYRYALNSNTEAAKFHNFGIGFGFYSYESDLANNSSKVANANLLLSARIFPLSIVYQYEL